jgi:hypothetical protein
MVFLPGSPAIDAIARATRLRLVIDHLALWGEQKDDKVYADLPRLVALARHPNVAVKASALPCYRRAYSFRGSTGSSAPSTTPTVPGGCSGARTSRACVPYRQAVTLFTEELSWLPAADLDGSWAAPCASGWVAAPA